MIREPVHCDWKSANCDWKCATAIENLRTAIGRFQLFLKFLFPFKDGFQTISGAWRGEMGVSEAFSKFCSLYHGFTLMVLVKKGNKIRKKLMKRPMGLFI